MADVKDFLDRILGKQKQVQQFTYPKVEEEDTELYNALMAYAKEHPEAQDEYPNFDAFAEHFYKNIYKKPQMVAEVKKTDKKGNVVEERTEVLKPATKEDTIKGTGDFLDRLIK